MFLLSALSLLVAQAHAAACVCARNVALPSAGVLRSGAGVFSLDYGAKLENEPTMWEGLGVNDLYGDSMAWMYMPPMLVHTASLGATIGLPKHFSVSATLPYMFKDNLGISGMAGDTDLSSLNDVDVTGHWAYETKDKKTFAAISAGPTFPTGTVVPNSPVRSGRGVFGATAALAAGTKMNPKVNIAAQLNGATGFGADSGGYTVAPTASLVMGAQWSPRENGKLSLGLLGIERWSGNDQQDALVYKNSGYLTTDLAGMVSYTFWAEKLRSASFSVRAQLPIYQVVGDPMYAENFGGSVGLNLVAF